MTEVDCAGLRLDDNVIDIDYINGQNGLNWTEAGSVWSGLDESGLNWNGPLYYRPNRAGLN